MQTNPKNKFNVFFLVRFIVFAEDISGHIKNSLCKGAEKMMPFNLKEFSKAIWTPKRNSVFFLAGANYKF